MLAAILTGLRFGFQFPRIHEDDGVPSADVKNISASMVVVVLSSSKSIAPPSIVLGVLIQTIYSRN